MVQDPWKAWAAGSVRRDWGRPGESRVLKDCGKDKTPSVHLGPWHGLWGKALARGMMARPRGKGWSVAALYTSEDKRDPLLAKIFNCIIISNSSEEHYVFKALGISHGCSDRQGKGVL